MNKDTTSKKEKEEYKKDTGESPVCNKKLKIAIEIFIVLLSIIGSILSIIFLL